MRILILCTGNSCRSQMAHGYLQSLDDNLEVFSAGTKPAERVHPFAIEAMKEIGIDISHHTPHNVTEYIAQSWDFVITVCGNADENCPIFSGKVQNRLHIGFDDPAFIGIYNDFVKIRKEIQSQFDYFYNKILNIGQTT